MSTMKLADLASSALDALTAHIAILDHSGDILAVNAAWRNFSKLNTPPGLSPTNLAEGTNYLDICTRAGQDDAASFADGVRDVLAGARDSYTLEYACETSTGMQWFIGVVTPLGGDGNRRLVIAHYNITERKRAEEALRNEEGRTKSLIVQLETIQASLHEKVSDLETFHDLVVDRELRMIELEKENQRLRDHTPDGNTPSHGNNQPMSQANRLDLS